MACCFKKQERKKYLQICDLVDEMAVANEGDGSQGDPAILILKQNVCAHLNKQKKV